MEWVKELPFFQVLDISLAYESGYGYGYDNRNFHNPYAQENQPSHLAYDFGYDAGQKKRKEREAAENPLPAQK